MCADPPDTSPEEAVFYTQAAVPQIEGLFWWLSIEYGFDPATHTIIRDQAPSSTTNAAEIYSMRRRTGGIRTKLEDRAGPEDEDSDEDSDEHPFDPEIRLLLSTYRLGVDMSHNGSNFRNAIIDAMAEVFDYYGIIPLRSCFRRSS